jgi:hypothetical protein
VVPHYYDRPSRSCVHRSTRLEREILVEGGTTRDLCSRGGVLKHDKDKKSHTCTTTGTLLRTFHRGGVFLVASWYKATYMGYGNRWVFSQKLRIFPVKVTYQIHSQWYFALHFQLIFRAHPSHNIPLRASFHFHTKNPVVNVRSSICTTGLPWDTL